MDLGVGIVVAFLASGELKGIKSLKVTCLMFLFIFEFVFWKFCASTLVVMIGTTFPAVGFVVVSSRSLVPVSWVGDATMTLS